MPEIGWPKLRAHPVSVVGEDVLFVIELWLAYRGERGELPFSGGAAEQPALIIEAFRICEAVDQLYRQKGRTP